MGILDDVTPAQREAITHIDGPLLVVAGAGSGKTRVITRRVAYLVERGIGPYSILAITFTNKAAGEMKERIEQLGASRGVWISTFHSMCARMLRQSPELIERDRNFVIYDTADQAACVKGVMKRLEISSQEYSPQKFRNAISRAKNDFQTPEQFAERVDGYFDNIVAKVYRLYNEALAAGNALDFDDLLMCAARLLIDNEDFRTRWQERFHYILVDEYQDTNRTQYIIARHLASGRRNLCATGDPDQSIYGWRGADLRNILDFQKDYPDARLVKLEENFRSTQVILDAASAVISNNVERIERDLFTTRQGGSAIKVFACMDEEDEAYTVGKAIIQHIDNGSSYGDFAVFYRTNAQSRAFETSFRTLGIPYVLVGAVEFYNRKEVKDITAYLRVVANEQDNVAAARIINVPPRGIGARTVATLERRAQAEGVSMMRAAMGVEAAGLATRAVSAVQKFTQLIATLKSMPQTHVADLVRAAIELTGYETMLTASSDLRADERIDNIRELASAAAEYDDIHPDGGLLDFLETVALVSDTDALPDDAEHVTLMTIHSAKGLEFPVVFITGMEQGLLPHAKALEDPNGEEEERRLFYVAVTRAQHELIITLTAGRRTYGALEFTEPSCFIHEIPSQLLEDQHAVPAPGVGLDADDEFAIDYDFDQSPPQDESISEFAESFRRGDYVEHGKFGRGRVLSVSGRGRKRTVRVSFAAGEKTLRLKFAALKRLP